MLKKRNTGPFTVLLSAIFLIAGCTAPLKENAQPTPTQTPAAQIAAVRQPTKQERAAALEKAVCSGIRTALAQYVFAPSLTMEELALQAGTWIEIARDIPEIVEREFQKACADQGIQPGALRCMAATWQFVAALFHRYGPDAPSFIAKHMNISLTESGEAELDAQLADMKAIMAGEEKTQVFGVTLTYTYLNTVYNDQGEEVPYAQYALDDAYVSALHDPLPGAHIKDGWYKSRDAGKRKHTGTDIRAKEDTPIHSCTDGVVLYIGVNEGAGNYVVVQDDAGFEYHYYHMVRMTDFLKEGDRVSAGDIVGNVGNTGNSSANHLHLGIISPEFTYINPYPVLRDMRKLQKQ